MVGRDPQVRETRRRLRRLIGEIPRGSTPRRRRWRAWLIGSVIPLAVIAYFAVPRADRVTFPVVPPSVEGFSIQDARGNVHDRDEWRDAKAVLLVALAPGSRKSIEAMPAIRGLADRASSRGVAVFGLVPDPSASRDAVRRMAEKNVLTFPILLDPTQGLTRDCEVAALPEAIVLDPQGHVLHRGAIGEETEKALTIALAGKWPQDSPEATVGDPLPAPEPLVDPSRSVTFNRDVAPILWKHCAGCHHPGDVAPFPLMTYRDAAKRAEFLRDVTESRQMPPWKAEQGHGDFLDENRLSRRELATIARWAQTGAREGEAADLPAPPTFPEGWRLGTPDLVLAIPEPFPIQAEAKDLYRAFVLPIPGDSNVSVSAVEFRPDNKRVVHHSRIYVDEARDCRKLDAADPAGGFEAFSGGGVIKPGLGAWIPGLVPRFPPEGVGRVLKSGSDLILMIHYHGTGKPEVDQSRIGLYFSKTPPSRWPNNVPLSTDKINIPPGSKRHRVTQLATIPADVHAYSILPHGHFLMREIRLVATLPDGQVKPLLWIKDWDFNWQGQYHFARPVALPKGTRLEAVAEYDNSAENPNNPNHPPIRVHYGYASHDEMFGCHLQILGDSPKDQAVLDKKWPNGL